MDLKLVIISHLFQDSKIDFFNRILQYNDGFNEGNSKMCEQSSCELLSQLISAEENYIANVLLKCLKLCPNAFGKSVQ